MLHAVVDRLMSVSLLWLSLLLRATVAGNCPLSEHIAPQTDLVHSYNEYFFTAQELAAAPDRQQFECILMWLKLTNCTVGMCPLREENLDSLIDTMSWRPFQTAICELNKANQSRSPYDLNLLFFGSSFTAGSRTMGQCCTAIQVNQSLCSRYHQDGDDYYCAWPGYFTRWLKKIFPFASINAENFGTSGFSSATSAYGLAHFLQNFKISKRDIIFLDNSITDNLLNTDRQHDLVKRGIETLIRTLYTVSIDGLPTIILLDQWPHAEKVKSKSVSEIYIDIANHYALHLWSPKRVLRSKFAEKYQNHFMSVLLKSYGIHPDWTYHLFLADLLSLGFTKSLTDCENPVVKTYSGVPDPLFGSESLLEDGVCNPTKQMLLEAFPNTTFTPSDLESFEANITTWTSFIDKHNVPGFIINNHARQSTLTFQMGHVPSENILTYALKITYLATYANAGKFQVVICGRLLDFDIDTLSMHHKSKRMSVPAVKSIEGSYFSACATQPVRLHNISIVYRPYFGLDGVDHGYPRHHEKVKILSVEVCHL